VGLVACAGAAFGANQFEGAHDVHVASRVAGLQSSALRAVIWSQTLTSILFYTVGLVGLAGVVYLVALRRARLS